MTARYEQVVRAHALHQELAAIYTALADEHVLTTDSLLAPVSGLEFIVYYREQWTPEQVITVLRYVEKRQHAYLHDFWDSVADNGFVHWYPHNRYRLFRERLFELPWLLSMRGFHESNFCRVTVEAFWDEKNWGASIP